MKILVVSQHYWPENFRINDLVEGFLEQGCEVDVLCGQPNYPQGEFFPGYDSHSVKTEQHGKVRVFRTFEVKRGNNSNLRIFMNYITFPIASYLRAGKLKEQYDRIFIYETSPVMMAAAGLRLQKKRHTETVMYVLDLWPQNLYSVLPVRNRLLRKLLSRISEGIYRRPDRLVTVSEKMRQYFIRNLARAENEVFFIPQCPEKLYEERKSDAALKERFRDGFRIVFTGNLSPAQNLSALIRVAARLKAEGYTDIFYLIVGDGMSAKDLRQEAEEAGLSEQFFFEGQHPMEEMPCYTGIADALIAMLKSEGVEDFTIPAKVMSYMASGRPLLLSMEGEICDIVREADCGLCSQPDDEDGLYRNILTLYRMSPEERDAMGERAFACQQARFERNKSLEQMLRVIRGTDA